MKLDINAAGYSYKEIAERLGVTYTNVNNTCRAPARELRQIESVE